jgi:hypothetical protein
MRPAPRLTTLAIAAIGLLALLALPAVAAAQDRNHDRIPDRWEKRHHLSRAANQAHRDQDRDRLRNRAEFLAGDNPRNADSDGDGVPDGEENAGTVQSFNTTTGKLVISLFGEETISGIVNEETEIQCEHEHSGASASSEDGGDEGSGDGQQGQEEPGEDQGEEAGEQEGEDQAEHSGEGEEASCTTANLVPGAVVHQAELKVENGTATFEEIELSGQSTTS